MGSQKAKAEKAVSAALKKDKIIDRAEAGNLYADFQELGLQAITRALASNKSYQLSSDAEQFTGIRDKKDGAVAYTGMPATDFGWMMRNGGPMRYLNEAPGKGWVATNVPQNGPPTYRYMGKGYKDLKDGDAGGKDGKKGDSDDGRGSGEFDAIISALERDAEMGRMQQQAFANMMIQSNYNSQRVTSELVGQMDRTARENTRSARQAQRRQQRQHQATLASQQEQIAKADAAAAEQARQSAALARAYVPNTQATADAPVLGDYRTGANRSENQLSSYSTAANNTLSGLAILGSSNGSLLSGLRIA